MKTYQRLLLTFGLSLTALQAGAQATLPAAWDFTSLTPPQGWWKRLQIVAGAENYTSSANYFTGPNSVRLDGTGENVGVRTASKPGKVSWYIRYTGNGTFNGTFEVQESADSSTWTTRFTYTGTSSFASVRRDSFTANANSRYVRWIFTTKASGFNIALDDVAVEEAPAGDPAELQVFYRNRQLLSNQELFMGDTTLFEVEVRNRGLKDTLNFQRLNTTGPDSSAFAGTGPQRINPGAKGRLDITFSPTGPNGTYRAVLEIFTSDSSQRPFLIRLQGVKGNLASEPRGRAGSLAFTQVLPYRLRMSFTAGTSSADRFLVLIRENAAVTDKPVDGLTYERGMWIGRSRVAYLGAPGTVNFDRIVANRTYHVAVFGLKGNAGFENYNDTAATASQLTPGKTPGTYYSSIDVTKPSLLRDLYNRTRPHFQVFYSNYASTFGEPFYAYDTTGGRRVMHCQYSNFVQLFNPPLAWTPNTRLSREHVYPYSWMGIASQDSANYSDLHVLVPVHQDSVNAVRSNFPMNELKTVVVQFRDGKFGLDSTGNAAYEPRDEIKGFVARAMFYMCVTYNRTGAAFSIPSPLDQAINRQSQILLKRWNEQFPPTDYEIARHEFAASIQNNRNPFIDNPDWACHIDFTAMSHIPSPKSPCGGGPAFPTSVAAPVWREIKVGPVPADEVLNIEAAAFQSAKLRVCLYDFNGRLVYSAQHTNGSFSLHTASYAAGNYLLAIEGDAEHHFRQVVVK
jgi:hypothetical protein